MNKTKSKATKELLSETERKYDCKECGKQMSNMGNLNAHIRAAHEGVKYPCQQCLYQATTKGSLEKHRRSVHEGIKYPCGQCEHQASSKSNLEQHRRSVHEEMKQAGPSSASCWLGQAISSSFFFNY